MLLVAQIYVYDILFGATLVSLLYDFSTEMKFKFEIDIIGELKFFLGIQVKKTN